MSISWNSKQQHQLPPLPLLVITKTHLIITHLLLLLLLLLPVAVPSSAASAQARTTLLPHCQTKCGNVSIPYPFGIGRSCRRDGFGVRCNASSNPPRLFIGDETNSSQIEIIDISLNQGSVSVYKQIDWQCYNKSGLVDSHTPQLDLQGTYSFSSATNIFVVVGCRDMAVLEGTMWSGDYYGGCLTMCDSLEGAIDDTCDGMGCCDTTIPKGLTSISTLFLDYVVNNSEFDVWRTNPCGYAFLIDHNKYRFSKSHLAPGNLNATYRNGAPVVLDWVIANETCEQARRNSTSFACVDKNSQCFTSSNASGYLCKCSTGYEGNPYLSDGCQDINECERQVPRCYGVCTNTPGSFSCLCPSGYHGDANTANGCIHKDVISETLKVAIGTIVCAFFVTLIGFLIYFGVKKRKLIKVKQKFFDQNGGLILQQQLSTHHSNSFKLFTLEEMEKATKKFDKSLIIGRGGHGTVYKGILEDERVVAIKKSRLLDDSQTKEFAKEMFILSQINHKNVIKLLGCCLEVEVPMLVYEFVPNGNLFQYLHGEKQKLSTSSLATRLRIAEESADALTYLHSSAYPPIIHGDVKSSNILLDEQFVAKVSDFGASRFVPKDEIELATVVQGTCGYLDPQYLITCQLTEKSDVYSFGVVILELLTGKKPLEFDASGEERNLGSICMSVMKENRFADVLDIHDQTLDEEDMILLHEVAKLALRCLRYAGEDRPTMREVAEDLRMLSRSKLSEHGKYSKKNINVDLEESSDDETKYTTGESVYGYDTTRSYNAQDQNPST